VAVQLAATMQLLTSNSDTCFMGIEMQSTKRPLKRRNKLNTIQPLIDERNSVGKTELFLTLAFLHKS
jgi:hypothetical protein